MLARPQSPAKERGATIPRRTSSVRRSAASDLTFLELGRSSLSLLHADGRPRLREGQFGGLLALGAHFSVRAEPAIIALPPGLGKTGVITMAPFILQASRVLVIVPSRILREQIRAELAEMELIRRLGIINVGNRRARVLEVRSRFTDAAAWDTARAYDFVVSTPQCVSAEISGIVGPPPDLFDLLLIDEAHHAAAPSWKRLIADAPSAKVAMFTATPYRLDAEPLPGSLIYDYPMTKAIENGDIAQLTLRQIDFDASGDPDASVIDAVRTLLTAESSAYRGVPFIARTNSVRAAKSLAEQYRNAGLAAEVVTSDHSLRHTLSVIRRFREGSISGIVMVGMLGEGFDFPDVKIAAYHRRHKSLPATLQFFGRVTRIKAQPGGPEPLVLVPKHDVLDATATLYREDANWAKLVPTLADNKIESVKHARRQRVALEETEVGAVSDDAISPRRVLDIFEVPDQTVIDLVLTRLTPSEQERLVSYYGDVNGRFVAYVEAVDEQPQWLRSRALTNRTYELRVVVCCPDENLLIVSSSSNTASRDLARRFGVSEPAPLSPETFFGLIDLHDVEVFYNLGTRNVEGDSDTRPAYLNRAGRSVAKSLTPADRENYGLGHAVFRYRDDNGIAHSFGVALGKSRVWMPERSVGLTEFIDWCGEVGRLVARARRNTAASVLGLRETRSFSIFPVEAVFAQSHRSLYDQDIFAIVAGNRRAIAELRVAPAVSQDRRTCRIDLLDDQTLVARVDYDSAGAATVETVYQIRSSAELDPLDADELFRTRPFAVYYADGSSSRGHLLTPPRRDIELIDARDLQALDWAGVAVNRERDSDDEPQPGIFSHMHQLLAREFASALVVNDDGAGEIADIIVVRELVRLGSSELVVKLYHCKGATGAGASLTDLYVVLGQLERSVWWLNRQRFWPEAARRFDSRFKIIQCSDRDVTRRRLSEWAQSLPQTSFEVYMVQPGIASAQLFANSNVNRFLLVAQSAVQSFGARFGVICS